MKIVRRREKSPGVFFTPFLSMQQISLQQVKPNFLEASQYASSDIWNKNIQFNKGERIQIVAPSGTGKTSLIHFLYGLRKDYSGEIKIDGQNLDRLNVEKLAVLRQSAISVVFQDLRLFLQHSVEENIEVKKRLGSIESVRSISSMCDQLGISAKLVQRCGTCSYGEQQRVAIIRALQQPFDFILLDEPFSHLDENNRQKAMKLIEEAAEARNATIILADLKPIEYFNADITYQL